MRKFRINNDIPVIWRVVDRQNLLPFYLEGKTVRVSLQNRFGVVPIEEFTASGNVISFIFKAGQQSHLGVYTATATITDAEGQTWTVDDCEMLELVSRSCCVDVCDCRGVDATSCVEFAQFIVVDQELKEGSRNPVAGGPVVEAFEGLGRELDYTKEGFKEEITKLSERITDNERRVLKYHVDPDYTGDGVGVLETGEDWLHNSAVLDWLFRNGGGSINLEETNLSAIVTQSDEAEFNLLFSAQIIIVGSEEDADSITGYFSTTLEMADRIILSVIYIRETGTTTWNKEHLEASPIVLQTVANTPVERGSGAHSLQQKAEPNADNIASGLCSAAFGHSNEATEHCSFVEGFDNASGGWASHVEGVDNVAGANAHFSHVGGNQSRADHEATFVHGRGLKTAAADQAVVGKWNALSGAAFVVGGGTSDTDRKNLFEVDRDGTVRTSEGLLVGEMKEVLYADLVALRDSAKLTPGKFYRITDFVTTVDQEDASSAGHPFDVIVLATSSNTLSEEAMAITHKGDSYFTDAGANLAAWKLWYCLDNDNSRFAWAAPLYKFQIDYQGYTGSAFREKREDYVRNGVKFYAYRVIGPGFTLYFEEEFPATGSQAYNLSGQELSATVTRIKREGPAGKGVIFRMIDEWGNDLPYDFKNVIYKFDNPTVDVTVAAYGSTFPGVLTRNASGDKDNGGEKYYAWIYRITAGPTLSGTVYTKSSELTEEIEFYSEEFTPTDIVTITSVIVEGYTFGGEADGSLDGGCNYNTIRPDFSNNIAQLNRIIFGNYCYSNSYGNNCYNNSYGNYCNSNSYGDNCNSNSYGDSCNSNSYGDYCYSNSYGNNCNSNSYGDNCYSNSYGNNCEWIKLLQVVGDSSADGNYFQYCKFESGAKYITITRTTVGAPNANVAGLHVLSGVHGSEDAPYPIKTGAAYDLYDSLFPETTVAVNSAGEVVIYCEADLASAAATNTEEA